MALAPDPDAALMLRVKQGNTDAFAMLVDKYKLAPKIMEYLEQAGLRWPPARLVHLCLVAFACAVTVSWLMLPLPKVVDLLVGLVAGCGPVTRTVSWCRGAEGRVRAGPADPG